MVKHKTFISYHHENEQNEKNQIIKNFDGEDFIDSSVMEGDIDTDSSEESIMRKIRENYLQDSTVLLVIVGEETAQRPFINSEIQASLWGDNPHGLLAVVTDNLYNKIYQQGTCNGPQCDCEVRHPINHQIYLPELIYKNRDIERNQNIDYIPCHYNNSEVYSSLVKFSEFMNSPDKYINKAFDKREELNYDIAKKLSEDTPKIQKNKFSNLAK